MIQTLQYFYLLIEHVSLWDWSTQREAAGAAALGEVKGGEHHQNAQFAFARFGGGQASVIRFLLEKDPLASSAKFAPLDVDMIFFLVQPI